MRRLACTAQKPYSSAFHLSLSASDSPALLLITDIVPVRRDLSVRLSPDYSLLHCFLLYLIHFNL